MRITTSLVTAALLLGSAAPAWAQKWDRAGSISVSPGRDQSLAFSRFTGPVARLNLDADRSDVRCRSVRVTFGNGRTRNVFSGTLRKNHPRVVDLPGDERNIRRVDFRCRALDRRHARIQISTWEDDDRRGAGNRSDRAQWVPLGREVFSGLGRETTYARGRARAVTAIGLRPVGDDARCTQVRAHFANGRSRDLNVGQRLREDRLHRVDVTRLTLVCRPVGNPWVRVDVFGLT